MPPTILLPEIVALTGRSEAWVRRNWLKLHEQHHFPRKLPGLWAWPRRAVEAWVAAGGFLPGLPAAANTNDPDPDLAAATSLLEHRFGISQ